jgi:hypothetical protein
MYDEVGMIGRGFRSSERSRQCCFAAGFMQPIFSVIHPPANRLNVTMPTGVITWAIPTTTLGLRIARRR